MNSITRLKNIVRELLFLKELTLSKEKKIIAKKPLKADK